MKQGDKVWFYMNLIQEVVEAEVINVKKYVEVRFKGGGTVGGLIPNFDVFPTKKALCEHYRKIFE